MAAPNRIYIEVSFLQQDAIAGVKALNQAISSIGPATVKSSMQASQGVSNFSLTVQEAQKAAQKTMLGTGYVERSQRYAESLLHIGEAAGAATQRVQAFNAAVASLSANEAAGAQRVADLNAQIRAAGNTTDQARQKFALLDQQIDRLAEAEDIARIIKLPGDLSHLSSEVMTTAKSFEHLGLTEEQAAQKTKALQTQVLNLNNTLKDQQARGAAFRAANQMDKGAILFDAEGARRQQEVRSQILGITRNSEQAEKAVDDFRKVTDGLNNSAGKATRTLEGYASALQISAVASATAAARAKAFASTPENQARQIGAIAAQTAMARAYALGTEAAKRQADAVKLAEKQKADALKETEQAAREQQRAFQGLGRTLVGLGALRVGQDMLATATSFERARIGLEALTGSANEAARTFGIIQDYAEKSPFAFKDLLQAETRLLAMQFRAKESIPILKAVGAAMAAVGGENAVGKMHDLITALGQIKAAGRVTGEEMRQLRNANIPALRYLSEAFGVTEAKMQKMITDGLVPADRAIAALVTGMVKQFSKFEQAVSKTASAALSNFNDAWDRFADEVIKDYLPTLTKFLNDKAIPALSSFAKVMKENKDAVEALGIAIAGFAAAKGVVWFFDKIAAMSAFFGRLGMGAAGGVVAPAVALTGTAYALRNNVGLNQGQFAPAAFATQYKPNVTGVGDLPMRPPPDWIFMNPPGLPTPPRELTEKEKNAILRRKKMITELLRDETDAIADAYADRLKLTDEYMTDEQQQAAEITRSRIENMREYRKRFYTKDEETGQLTRITGKTPQEQAQLVQAYAAFVEQQRIREAAINEKWDQKRRDDALKNVADTIAIGHEMWAENLDLEGTAWRASLDQRKQYAERIEDEMLASRRKRLEAQRDLALAQLEGYDDTTAESRIALSQKRMQIEDEHLQKSLKLAQEQLAIDQKRVLAQMDINALITGQINMLGMMTPEYAAARAEAVRQYAAQGQELVEETNEKRELNRLQNVTRQAQIVRSELQQTFEYFQTLAEGVFDALLGKSKSIAQAMADFVKTTVISMIKAIYTNAIAAMMMRAFGLPVPQQAGNPVLRMLTGGGGGIGGISGGGMMTAASLFAGGGGGTYSGSGGTSGGGGLMSYAGNAGLLASFAKKGWLGALFTGGGKFVPRALTGPISTAGSVGMAAPAYGANAANLAWTGALQTSGIAGSTGLGATLAGMGLFNTGSIAMGGYATTAAGIGGTLGSLAGFASSPGGILAGLALLGYGVKRGGGTGAAMTIGGGALAGFGIGAQIGAVGGPLGMAIGAGIGGVLGIIGILRKSAEEKLRDRIKSIYRVDISDNKVLQQILEIAKNQYGGDLNVAVFSAQVRDIIQYYKMSKSQEGRPMYPVSYAMSGGQLSLQPVYSGSSGTVSNPYSGPTTTQMAAMPVYVQLNPQQANDLFEGKVVQVIDANPESVANANAAVAGDSSARRMAVQNAILEPLTLLR